MTVLHPCPVPYCPNLVAHGRCAQHQSQQQPEAPRHNAAIRRWYNTARWHRLRAMVLAEEPLCYECQAIGLTAASTDVDHVTPHQGDPTLFWDRGNLRGMCNPCHTRKTSRGL